MAKAQEQTEEQIARASWKAKSKGKSIYSAWEDKFYYGLSSLLKN